MNCRPGCAACCIHISISSSMPGYPVGKPAGERCKNLDKNNLCSFWGTELYPQVCANFQAEEEYCGQSNEDAFIILSNLEKATEAKPPV